MNNSNFPGGDTDIKLKNFIHQYGGEYKKNNFDPFKYYQVSPQLYHTNKTNNKYPNDQFRKQSDLRTFIQQFMIKKQFLDPLSPGDLNINYNTARPILLNTEQKIFQQIVNLLLEINQIKQSIQKQKQITSQMENQRDFILNKGNHKIKGKKGQHEIDAIINKVKGKDGDDLKISNDQLEKFVTENQLLQKNINRLKIKSKGNLKQVLEDQKERYKALKKRLDDKNKEVSQTLMGISNPQVIQQINRLQSDIERLEEGIQDGSRIGYEIKRLSQQNERLRQKTMSFIRQTEHDLQLSEEEQQERRKLQEYIRQEQQNKVGFFNDLKLFKKQYEQLREQNQQLKKKIKTSKQGQRIQNIPSLSKKNQSQKYYNHSYNQNVYGQNQQKFIKYQDLMSQMNKVMR